MLSFICKTLPNGDIRVRGDNWTYDEQGNEEYHLHSLWIFSKGDDVFNLSYEKFRSYYEEGCIFALEGNQIISINDQKVN